MQSAMPSAERVPLCVVATAITAQPANATVLPGNSPRGNPSRRNSPANRAMRRGEEAARRAAWLAAAAHELGIPAVITEEDPETNGPTDEAVLAPLEASAPVFTKTVFGLASCPEI